MFITRMESDTPSGYAQYSRMTNVRMPQPSAKNALPLLLIGEV